MNPLVSDDKAGFVL
nr:unnamed protein product [Callosobruchus chinensis]